MKISKPLLLEFIQVLQNPTALRNEKRFELLEQCYLEKHKLNEKI